MTEQRRTHDSRPELTIVVPAHNEERRLPASLEAIRAFLTDQPFRSELLVVDDGSTDRTIAVVEAAARHFPPTVRVGAIALARNLGKGAAVRNGCLAARGRYIVYMDADLAVPVEETARVLGALREGCRVVAGTRIQPDGSDMRASQPVLRRVAGRLFTRVRGWLVPCSVEDTQCPMKGFEREAARALFRRQRLRGWAFDAEILYLAERDGLEVCQVPVAWRHVEGGRLRPSPALAATVAWDLVRLRFLHLW